MKRPKAASAPARNDLVLVVDDDDDIRRIVAVNLDGAGFRVATVDTAGRALAVASEHRPSVVVLDLMLPDQSGTDVCRKLRADPVLADTAVLMLTARADEYDRLLGFEVGADDYVVKPFSVRELVERVKRLAARARDRQLARAASDESQRRSWRGLEVDHVRHRVTLDGAELGLRPLEYKLLGTFIQHPGRVFSRADLLHEVWGSRSDTSSRTVDTHIRRLRERLDTYGAAIETVPGFGYRLRDASAVLPALACSQACALYAEDRCPYR